MKELLTAITVVFKPVGATRMLKSRTVAWECPACLKKNPYWNIPSGQAPGMKSEGLERVRAQQALAVGAARK